MSLESQQFNIEQDMALLFPNFHSLWNQQPFNASMPPPSELPKKRTQVKRACVNCQKSCKKCEDIRPCPRCVRLNIQDSCVDSERKVRKPSGNKRICPKKKVCQSPPEQSKQVISDKRIYPSSKCQHQEISGGLDMLSNICSAVLSNDEELFLRDDFLFMGSDPITPEFFTPEASPNRQ